MKKINNLIVSFLITLLIIFCSFPSSSLDKKNIKEKIETFDKKEMVEKAKIYFADLSEGVGIVVERSFNDFGQPSAYIEGNEFSAAFFGGIRYGEGQIFFKDGTKKDIYWNGPSVGFDFGANASKVFTLIYNIELENIDEIYGRFPDLEGTLFIAAGLAINYQKKNDIIITPVRSGIGLRAGVNLGYTKYTKKKSLLPF